MFERLRGTFGDQIELLHDIHERIPPIQAIGLAKELEKYNLFFLEDPFAPEDIEYFRFMRQQTAIPIAMGELFVNQAEYVPLIRDRLITGLKIDDAEPPDAQRDAWVNIETLTVGAAVA